MKKYIALIVVFVCSSCAVFQPKHFTDMALNEVLQTTDRKEITFAEILQKNKGKKKVIQVFATYCPVSQDSFKDVAVFQEKNPSISYVFLSVDHSYLDWKRGLENIPVKGQHYYIPKKGKGALGAFLKLKTIPRFIVVDEKGKILLYKSSQVSEKITKKVQ